MTSLNENVLSIGTMCARVKKLGYARSAKVRLYGEDFEVLSDPFPEANGVAVRVKATKDARIPCLTPARDSPPKCESPWPQCRIIRAS